MAFRGVARRRPARLRAGQTARKPDLRGSQHQGFGDGADGGHFLKNGWHAAGEHPIPLAPCTR